MDKKDKILFLAFVALLILSLYNMIMEGPVTMDDLTVEERIRYEQMIFP